MKKLSRNPILKLSFIFCLLVMETIHVNAQGLQVHNSKRYLQTDDGKPFFWLADTAWELFHRCNREEARMYLLKRKQQGFNVIQAVALAELDGLNTGNAYGERPLINNDLRTPNEDYFEHVDFIIKLADSLDIYIALLPTWGDKLFKNSWGTGPEIFTTENSKQFGGYIGRRYRSYDNVIWVVGGDRNPRENSDDVEVWNKMAEGICEGVGGCENALMTFHPQPKEDGGSSTWFHAEEWLDFNMHQTGHCANQGTYKHINHDYALSPRKPVLDGEPLYEDHPNCFNAKELGHSVASDIRRIMYWNVFAGAFGQTYGCHDVWQMFKLDKEGINQPLRPWPEALDLPMANQVKHLKNLFLSRPFFDRIPDQSLILSEGKSELEHIGATRDISATYAMVYLPEGGEVVLNLSKLSGAILHLWWFDPRTGSAFPGGEIERSSNYKVAAPSSGRGNDWVLVIDSMDYAPPGQQ